MNIHRREYNNILKNFLMLNFLMKKNLYKKVHKSDIYLTIPKGKNILHGFVNIKTTIFV